MSDIPADLKFLKSHEWVRMNDEGVATVGISDHAQSELGDMVFVELPAVGDMVSAGQQCAVVESVKAASDVYSPLSGEVVSVNDALAEAPENVNNGPFADGWLFAVRPSDLQELDKLIDAATYAELIAG